MQREVTRHLDAVRALENSYDSTRQVYPQAMVPDPGAPLSPRQVLRDDSRRPSVFRPPVPAHLSDSPRRYGSVGGANASPSNHRPAVTVQPPAPHPLSSASSPPGPNLARRHTSADIRQHGWPASASSPFSSNTRSSPWSPSPHKAQPANSNDQNLRDVLAKYEMGRPTRQPGISRHSTPPPPSDFPPPSHQDGTPSLGVPKFPRPADASLPATRRSSMASNVHSLLNPTDTAERAEEDDGPIGEDRKRKRLQ